MRRAGRTEKEERPFPSLADRRSEPEKAEHVQRQTGRKAGTQSQEAKAAVPPGSSGRHNVPLFLRRRMKHDGKENEEDPGPGAIAGDGVGPPARRRLCGPGGGRVRQYRPDRGCGRHAVLQEGRQRRGRDHKRGRRRHPGDYQECGRDPGGE